LRYCVIGNINNSIISRLSIVSAIFVKYRTRNYVRLEKVQRIKEILRKSSVAIQWLMCINRNRSAVSEVHKFRDFVNWNTYCSATCLVVSQCPVGLLVRFRKWNQMSSRQTIIFALSEFRWINRNLDVLVIVVQSSPLLLTPDIHQPSDVDVGVVFVVFSAAVEFPVRATVRAWFTGHWWRSSWIAVIGSQILHIFIVSAEPTRSKARLSGIVAATHAADHPCTLDASVSKLIGHCWALCPPGWLPPGNHPPPHAFPPRPADRLVTGWPLNGRCDPWSCPSIRRRGWSSSAWLSRPATHTVVDLNGCDRFSASPIPRPAGPSALLPATSATCPASDGLETAVTMAGFRPSFIFILAAQSGYCSKRDWQPNEM